MSDHTENPLQALRLRSSLRGALALWFLTLALVPLAISGFIGYRNAHTSLKAEIGTRLKTIATLKGRLVENYFNSIRNDLEHQIDRPGYRRLLELPRDSDAWHRAAASQRDKLAYLSDSRGYLDLMLFDDRGERVFALDGDGTAGGHLDLDASPPTALCSVYMRALRADHSVFSDFLESDTEEAPLIGYLARAIASGPGERPGVLVLRVNARALTEILSDRTGQGDTGRTLLVGTDRHPRGLVDGEETGLHRDRAIANTIVDRWLAGRAGGDFEGPLSDRDFYLRYTDHDGHDTLGVCHDLYFAETRYGVITEIHADEAFDSALHLRAVLACLLSSVAVIVTFIAVAVSRRLAAPLRNLAGNMLLVARGDLDRHIDVDSGNEIGLLAANFNNMLLKLREVNGRFEEQLRHRADFTDLATLLVGEMSLEDVSAHIIAFLCDRLRLDAGAVYHIDDDRMLRLKAQHPEPGARSFPAEFRIGEGEIGRCAAERPPRPAIGGVPLPADGSDENHPAGDACVFPIVYENRVKAVILLEAADPIRPDRLTLLDQAKESIAIAFTAAMSKDRVERLLLETRHQAHILRVQKDALRDANLASEERATALERSQADLRRHRERLELQKGELETRNRELERQKDESRQINRELRRTQLENALKTRAIEQADRYKSEFLANMSHELRTPLNSMLLLAQTLVDNREDRLSAKEVRAAETILSSGRGLLVLINDILDLAKVEAGKTTVDVRESPLADIVTNLRIMFEPMADDKGLEYAIVVDETIPERLRLDPLRVEQILRNLLGNAFKFTDAGKVTLHIYRPSPHIRPGVGDLAGDRTVAFAVSDTGIGMDEETIGSIFDPFNQADGTTHRRFGGTGLGLTISRRYADLLGGTIKVFSEPGKGSTFTLFLPLDAPAQASRHEADEAPRRAAEMDDPHADAVAPPPPPADTESPTNANAPPARAAIGDRFLLLTRDRELPRLVRSGIPDDAEVGCEIADDAEQAAADLAPFAAPDARDNADRGMILAGKRVLFVAERIRDLFSLIDTLRGEGMEIALARNGGEALAAVDGEDRIDLALIDIPATDGEGLETLARIRERKHCARLPIIALTADERPGLLSQCARAGADDHLVKPVGLTGLHMRLMTWLQSRGRRTREIV